LLEALESCATLFDHYGGHAHAVGFALPATRVPELRAQLDAFASNRLSPLDLEPVLEFDGEIALDQVTPELFQALRLLEPFGMENPQPVFAARAIRLLHPPRIVREKHLKLKLSSVESRDRSVGSFNWRHSVTYDATGWRMADRAASEQLLPGDVLDIAFTVGQNDHPDFGGLELTLCDFTKSNAPTVFSSAERVPVSDDSEG